jgi:ketosteroid isomerase-like protein
MPTDAQIEIVNRISDEVWRKGNIDVLRQVVTPDFKYHDPAASAEDLTIEGYEQFISGILAANSNVRYSILDMVLGDNAIAVHYRFEGKFSTGTQIEHEGAVFYHFEGEKVTKIVDIWDALGVRKQLGLTE